VTVLGVASLYPAVIFKEGHEDPGAAMPQPDRNVSRKGAKVAKENGKYEARNPKLETMSNDQKKPMFQTKAIKSWGWFCNRSLFASV
jgi:hypothetical protein